MWEEVALPSGIFIIYDQCCMYCFNAWLFTSEITNSISEGRFQNSERPTSDTVDNEGEDDDGILSKIKRKIFGWWRCQLGF